MRPDKQTNQNPRQAIGCKPWPEQSGWLALISCCTVSVETWPNTEAISYQHFLSSVGLLRGTPSQQLRAKCLEHLGWPLAQLLIHLLKPDQVAELPSQCSSVKVQIPGTLLVEQYHPKGQGISRLPWGWALDLKIGRLSLMAWTMG